MLENKFGNFTRAVALTAALAFGAYGCAGLQRTSNDVNKTLNVQTHPLKDEYDGIKRTLFYDVEYSNEGNTPLKFLKTEKCYTFNGKFDRCEVFNRRQMVEQIGLDSIKPGEKLKTKYPSHFWTDTSNALLEATIYTIDSQGKEVKAIYTLWLQN